MDVDILFLERPCDGPFIEAAKIAKDLNIKLWVDFDDNLFCVPPWNNGFKYYGQQGIRKNIIKCLQMADIITVATPAIKDEFSSLKKDIEVIPNAFNNYNFDFDHNFSDRNIIIWRGSNTHRGDLFQYNEQIWDVAKRHNKWNWEFIGNELWYIVDNIERKNIIPELHLSKYFKTIKEMNPAVYIVPLDFNKFNRSKSNCGWLEMTYAGAVTLAPNMPEWDRPGITRYNNQNDFKFLLETLIDNKKLREDLYSDSFEYIKEHLLLSDINKKRISIIHDSF